VTFMHYDLGYFDDEVGRLEPIEIRSARECYLCLRNEVLPMSPEWTAPEMAPQAGFEPSDGESRSDGESAGCPPTRLRRFGATSRRSAAGSLRRRGGWIRAENAERSEVFEAWKTA